MFTIVHDDVGQCTRKKGAPLSVPEAEHEGKTLFAPFEGVLLKDQLNIVAPRVKKTRRGDHNFINKFNDTNIFVELLWASRNPAARDCPFSRHEVQQRLGAFEDNTYYRSENKELNKQRHQKTQDEMRRDFVPLRRTLNVAGIGEMPLSDESTGTFTSNKQGHSSDDEMFLHRLRLVENINKSRKRQPFPCDTSTTYKVKWPPSETDIPEDTRNTLEDNAWEPQQRKNKEDSHSAKLPLTVTSLLGEDRDGLQPAVIHFPDKIRYLSSRIDNTTYLFRSPCVLAQALLQYMVASLLASHSFGDAVHLLAVYLITFSRASHAWINLNDYRLLNRFFVSAPDVLYSSMRIKILEQCFGNPTFLNTVRWCGVMCQRHDILYDVVFLRCCRREPQQAMAYLERFITSHSTADRILGTVHACMAWSLYSKWLLDSMGDTIYTMNLAKSLEQISKSVGSLRSTENIRHQLDTAVLHSWKHHRPTIKYNTRPVGGCCPQILPTQLIRLLILCYISRDTEKLWSFLQDLLCVAPLALDLLELQLLLAQRHVQDKDINQYIVTIISGVDQNQKLIDAIMRYSLCSRGEPAAFTLALQSFKEIPLVVRLQCILVFLESNVTYPAYWRVLVDETLGALGKAIGASLLSSAHEGTEEALRLWRIVDKVVSPTGKIHWHRRLFDAKRTSISMYPFETKIFVFLVAPFFLSSWNFFMHLARYIFQNGSQFQRFGPLVVPKRKCYRKKFFTSPATEHRVSLSADTTTALMGFSSILTAVFENNDESNHLIEQSSFVFDTTVLEMITEAAFRLVPRPTIANTTAYAALHREGV